MCMHVTDIRRESYRVFVSPTDIERESYLVFLCYGYQEGELSCVCMLRISEGRAIMCMYVTDIRREAIVCKYVTDSRRESCHVYVCYIYQE